jgi:hypothetical protein
MVHKLKEETVRVHCHIYSRDITRIEAMFTPRLKFATALRELVRVMLDRIEAEAKQGVAPLPTMDDLDLGEQE